MNSARRMSYAKHSMLGFPVFVVDDGSTDSSYEKIKDIPGMTLIRHEINRGKGAAIKTGFAAATRVADWAITIDADGQHDPRNAVNLINAIPSGPRSGRIRPIVIGIRENMAADDVPWTSRFGRGFSNFWVWVSGGPTGQGFSERLQDISAPGMRAPQGKGRPVPVRSRITRQSGLDRNAGYRGAGERELYSGHGAGYRTSGLSSTL